MLPGIISHLFLFCIHTFLYIYYIYIIVPNFKRLLFYTLKSLRSICFVWAYFNFIYCTIALRIFLYVFFVNFDKCSKVHCSRSLCFPNRCGHCKKLAPEYEKLGSSFKKSKSVLVGKVSSVWMFSMFMVNKTNYFHFGGVSSCWVKSLAINKAWIKTCLLLFFFLFAYDNLLELMYDFFFHGLWSR